MTDTRYIQRVRTRLFYDQNGLCYWCRKPMRLVERPDPNDTSPRMCTLDHRFGRGDPERGKHPGKRINVAACRACNHSRGGDQNPTPSTARTVVRAIGGTRPTLGDLCPQLATLLTATR